MSRVSQPALAIFAAAAILGLSGCTSLNDYVHNGFKVGPNYQPARAEAARNWIDANDVRVRRQADDLSKWWTVFNDPKLDALISDAYRQNLSLKVAACRVLEARAQMAIDTGNLFPQTQAATGGYSHSQESKATFGAVPGAAAFNNVNLGFNLSWEIDFWGRLRRAVESDAANVDASVENYDDVLVTLLGDVATYYVAYRTAEQRIKYAKENVALQTKTLGIIEAEQKAGVIQVTVLDVYEARSTLEQTKAGIPELEIAQRQAANQLCILLGIPPKDLQDRLGAGPIPTAPPEAAVGIPADLLRRRPDVRRAERQAAAQSAQIGIAEAEFYPAISITGAAGSGLGGAGPAGFGWSAQNGSQLFTPTAFGGSIGPSFNWNILNYGRLLNNKRLQEARFQELIVTYRNTVLSADQDVENGLVTFLRAQQRKKSQAASVDDEKKAVEVALAVYKAGAQNIVQVTLLQQNLVGLEDTLAQAEGEIATGLIQVYRALGGGWEIRLSANR